MPSHKDHSKLEQIKDAINSHPSLDEETKSNTIAKIEEWYAEDKGFGYIYEKLTEISNDLKAYLEELGLV